MTAIPPEALAEFAAAVALARRYHATLDIELASDERGNLRVRLRGIRGVSLQDLVGFDRCPKISTT